MIRFNVGNVRYNRTEKLMCSLETESVNAIDSVAQLMGHEMVSRLR